MLEFSHKEDDRNSWATGTACAKAYGQETELRETAKALVFRIWEQGEVNAGSRTAL